MRRLRLANSQTQCCICLFTMPKKRYHSVVAKDTITKPEWSQILPAIAVFNAAQKSKFLSFNRHKAEQILTDLWINGVNRNKKLDPKDSLQICQSMFTCLIL